VQWRDCLARQPARQMLLSRHSNNLGISMMRHREAREAEDLDALGHRIGALPAAPARAGCCERAPVVLQATAGERESATQPN